MTDTFQAPEPKVFAKHCARVDLPAGNHAWCRCGYSKEGAFCDGAHRGKGFTPIVFTLEDPQEQSPICLCKHTKTPPYCDGSHKTLV